MGLLTTNEIESQLPGGWTFETSSNNIWREFEKASFLEAVQFMNMIAPLAEIRDHHPDLFLHSYKKVKVTLTSHDSGGVTERDINLAKEINAL